MKRFIPPTTIIGEPYDHYFTRLILAMKEHYEEFLKELQDETKKL